MNPQGIYMVGPPPPLPAYNVQQLVQQKVVEEQLDERAELRKTITEEQTELRSDMRWVNLTGLLFTLAALVMLVVAFATSEWIVYNVTYPTDPLAFDEVAASQNNYICSQEDTLKGTQTCSMFYTRHRGLFYTFYNNPGFFAKAYPPNMYFGSNVWEQGYKLPGTPLVQNTICGNDLVVNETISFSVMDTRTSLMRAHWVMFVLGIALLFFACMASLAACFGDKICAANTASAFCFFGMLMALIGMCCFHGYVYLESSLLTCPPFVAILTKSFFNTLRSSTNIYYSYSMFLGWASVASSLFGLIGLSVYSCHKMELSSKISRAKDRLFRINKMKERERVLREKEARRIAAERLKVANNDANNRLQLVNSAVETNEMAIMQRKLAEDRAMLAAQELRLQKLNTTLGGYSPPPSPGPLIKAPFQSIPQYTAPAQSFVPTQLINPADPYTLTLPTGGASPPPYF